MWLLSTDCSELRFFTSPEYVDGGYAILSHTWGDTELSFQCIREIQDRCSASGEDPRKEVSSKIQKCCQLAEEHGYDWVWIDTCCIDKTSSTELSEAIRSMFRWYACAEVCFAFLQDVPTDCDLHAEHSAFRNARWHSRGWTLQELIAPVNLVFVSEDWTEIGEKHDLADLLEEITGVRSGVLTREIPFLTIGVAERMSWASKRFTTRLEDQAYCLIGLFDVNMPTIYGEGRQAFQRLQQEIMRQSADTSLFAWETKRCATLNDKPWGVSYGNSCITMICMLAYLLNPRGISYRSMMKAPSRSHPLVANPYSHTCPLNERGHSEHGTEETKGPFGSPKLPRFALTNCGIHCHLPIIELKDFAIAVLLCETRRVHIGLVLHPSSDTDVLISPEPSSPIYRCGYGFTMVDGKREFCRLISLGPDIYNIQFHGKTVTAEWRDVFIAASPPLRTRDEALLLCAPLNRIRPVPPFYVPQWLVGRLTMMGLERCSLELVHGGRRNVADTPFTAQLVFENLAIAEAAAVTMGLCTKRHGGDEGPTESESGRPHHWAKAGSSHERDWNMRFDDGHVCAEHHVDAWADWTKEFGDGERRIRLSFSRRKVAPDTTLVLHVELEGSVYDAMKARKRLTFPPRKRLADGSTVAVAL